MLKRLVKKIQRIFWAGLLVTAPTMLSFFLLRWLVNYIDKISAPLVNRFFHVRVPGIGFAVTIILILTVGIFGTNIIGRKFVALGESLLSRIPLVKNIYTSAKQIIETVIFATEKPFQQMVLVPYPREKVYALGLATRKVPPALLQSLSAAFVQHTPPDADEQQLLSVFIPSTPNFTGGLLVMFPVQDVIPLAMTIEEGFTYLMTGGISTPKNKQPETPLQQLEDWELFLH